MTKSLLGKILIMFFIVILVVSGVSGILTNYFIKKYILYSKQQEMIRQGQRVINLLLKQELPERRMGMMHSRGKMWFLPVRERISEIEDTLGVRIWTMDIEGQIYEELKPIHQLTTNELKGLLKKDIITKYNWNDELSQPVLAVILPMAIDKQVIGGLLVVTPMKEIQIVQSKVRRIITGSAWIGGIVAVILAIFFSRRLTRPILKMQNLINKMRQGDFSGYVEITGQDELSELVRHFNNLNSELNETIGLLKTEKEQTKRIINSMAEGVISITHNDEIMIINPTALRLLNLEAKDVITLDKILLKLPLLKEMIERVKKEKKPVVEEIRRDNTVFLSILSPVSPEEGGVPGIVIVIQDITNRWRLVQMQKEIIANVSHEFKTPLTSIKGFLELMLDKKIKSEETIKDALEIIYRETLRLIRMVEGILQMAKMEAKKLCKEDVLLKGLIDRVLESLSLKLKEKQIKIKIDISNELKVYLDPDKMGQVFYNLLENGIRFSPEGGIIEIKALESNNFLEIKVRDQGPGIPEKERDWIFDRFYKIEKARSADDSGSGLGLSIVKGIVEEHEGKIWVENHPESGAIFIIRLPV